MVTDERNPSKRAKAMWFQRFSTDKLEIRMPINIGYIALMDPFPF